MKYANKLINNDDICIAVLEWYVIINIPALLILNWTVSGTKLYKII